MAQKHYDSIVIGSGISGLLMASSLIKAGHKTAVLEAAPHAGGWNRSNPSKWGNLEHGLRILPWREETEGALNFIKDSVPFDFSYQIQERPLLTFEKGSLIPFVGFGANNPQEADIAEYFLSEKVIEIDLGVSEFTEKLALALDGVIQLKSQVTKFQMENGKITGAFVNGSKLITGDRYFFCGNPQDLLALLPEGTLSPKTVQKLSRTRLWTAVALDIIHPKEITNRKALHVLRGGGDTALVCLGEFRRADNTPEGKFQVSRWLSFLPTDDADEETTTSALKEMKRQIKRAYPDALDATLFERILVSPRSHGFVQLSKEEKTLTIPGVENLWGASSFFGPHRNIGGSLIRTTQIAQSLGKIGEISDSEAPIACPT